MTEIDGEDDVDHSTDHSVDHSASVLDKICLVCGDRALSCNFGAITCESCKAFFRRNAAKEWSSKCDGHCPITVETRSYCKKCRLLKCLEVGMNKSLILSEEQKKLRKQKIMENKMKRGVHEVHVDAPKLKHIDPGKIETMESYACHPLDLQAINTDPTLNLQSSLQSMSPDLDIHPTLQAMKHELSLQASATLQHQPGTIPLITDDIKKDQSTRDPFLSSPTGDCDLLSSISLTPIIAQTNLPPDNIVPSNLLNGTSSLPIAPVTTVQSTNGIASFNSLPNMGNGPLGQPAVNMGNENALYMGVRETGPPQNYAQMFPPENKKQRTASGDSLMSDGSPDFPIAGIVATRLKVLMDSQNFQDGLRDLPDPIICPSYGSAFEGLSVDNWVFMKHIDQLRYASSTAFNNAKKNNKCPRDPSYVQIFNFSETSIKCLVTLAKNLEPFLALSTDDQILLLKNSILEMMVLGSASSYDHKHKGWVVVDGDDVKTVETTTVKSTREGNILMGHYELIILYVLSASRRDLGIIVLLTILTLFSMQGQSAQCDLQDKQKVDEGYKIYLNVLKIYTSIKYPDRPSMMENLLRSLDVVRDFSETYMQSILKSPLNKINPLLLEIFDLPLP